MKGTLIVLGITALAFGGAATLGTMAHVRWGICPAWERGWGGVSGIVASDEVPGLVGQYLAEYGDPDWVVGEIMEFSNHFYVEVREKSTGRGAVELLVLRDGSVRPEPGPNMMWNAKYGHRGMMGFRRDDSGVMDLPPAAALATAQAYLDRSSPGLAVGDEAEAFYGYYTIHTLRNGKIVGMLSVHGSTGEVWVHTWHNAFVGLVPVVEGDPRHDVAG
ncbi:MAG: hypothetical protein Kow0097_05920 [Candidatus Bipolaricaulota bacterium]